MICSIIYRPNSVRTHGFGGMASERVFAIKPEDLSCEACPLVPVKRRCAKPRTAFNPHLTCGGNN
jgi:hypothetical protein